MFLILFYFLNIHNFILDYLIILSIDKNAHNIHSNHHFDDD